MRPVGGSPGSQAASIEQRRLVPACNGNTRLDPGEICAAAREFCQDQPNAYAYWTWTATFDRATGRQRTPWTQQVDPLTVCRGLSDPAVPTGPTIADLLVRDFQRLVVQRGVVTARPAGRTLVNFETRLTTDAGDYDLPALTLLGSRVQLRARATRYTWTLGDGEVQVAGPSTTHRYLQPAAVGVSVRITWSGTYTVDDGPVHTVNGTAVTTGPRTRLQVLEAHAERVSR